MTDLATALADTSSLEPFDGKDVLRATIAVTNAGDGLSESMAVDPRELHMGQRVRVVLDCEVSKITFKPVPKTGVLERVHTLRAEGAAFIEAEVVDEVLRTQAARIALVREQAAGIARIGNSDQLEADHRDGGHDDEEDGVEGCPMCQSIRDEKEAEEAGD